MTQLNKQEIFDIAYKACHSFNTLQGQTTTHSWIFGEKEIIDFSNKLRTSLSEKTISLKPGDSIEFISNSDQLITVPEGDQFVIVPETTLPCGTVVPSFMVGKYACSQSDNKNVKIVADRKPWVNINYKSARAACTAAGYSMITETQWLALAHNVTNVDANWTKGKVGAGKLFQGIRKGLVSEAQAGNYQPNDNKERRWLTLSNGETICDINGNVFQWVFDDLHGDDKGLINKAFADTDPSLTTAPYPSEKKGMGWRPDGGRDWSGAALIRGGCWSSYGGAGVFRLSYVWPQLDNLSVGFRCTKSA